MKKYALIHDSIQKYVLTTGVLVVPATDVSTRTNETANVPSETTESSNMTGKWKPNNIFRKQVAP